MNEEKREYWRSILNGRVDVHPSKIEYHMKRLDGYCLHKAASRPTRINGQTYFLFCGEPIGHKTSHQDIEGGVFWDGKKHRCARPNCSKPVKFTSPKELCSKHWKMWWKYGVKGKKELWWMRDNTKPESERSPFKNW